MWLLFVVYLSSEGKSNVCVSTMLLRHVRDFFILVQSYVTPEKVQSVSAVVDHLDCSLYTLT